MKFDPVFALLQKFTAGLPVVPVNEDEISAVARYLGVDLGSDDDYREMMLFDELSEQNAFLSYELGSDAIFEAELYRRSLFIREIVANNRLNLKNHTANDG